MNSLFGTPRRGLRAIVKRGPIIAERVNGTTHQWVDLELECGHAIRRGAGTVRAGRPSAVCPTCKVTDGEKRDSDRAAE